MQSRNREVWIDLIKVIATIFILLQHTLSYSWMNSSVHSAQWMLLNFIFMLSRFAVPFFIMCSGIGMLSRKRTIKEIWRKNIASLLCMYVSWMTLYGLISAIKMAVTGDYSIRVLFNAVVKSVLFGEYHTWFVMMLIGLYMVTPFVYMVISEEKNIIYFLIMAFLFTFLVPFLEQSGIFGRLDTQISSLHMNMVTGYLYYFVVGWFLAKCRIEEKRNNLILVMSVLLVGIAYGVSLGISIWTGIPNQDVYGEFSVLGACCSTGLFYLATHYFRRIEPFLRKESVRNGIKKVGKYGIGIYLIHPQMIQLLPQRLGILYNILEVMFIWGTLVCISWLLDYVPGVKRVFFKG